MRLLKEVYELLNIVLDAKNKYHEVKSVPITAGLRYLEGGKRENLPPKFMPFRGVYFGKNKANRRVVGNCRNAVYILNQLVPHYL